MHIKARSLSSPHDNPPLVMRMTTYRKEVAFRGFRPPPLPPPIFFIPVIQLGNSLYSGNKRVMYTARKQKNPPALLLPLLSVSIGRPLVDRTGEIFVSIDNRVLPSIFPIKFTETGVHAA